MKRLISLLTLLVALSVNAQTIHWITFIDTNDPVVGECDKKSRQVLYSRFVKVVNGVLAENGYKSKIHDYHGDSVTPQNCKKIVESLHCDLNDIIFFYYIGHGAHGIGDSNPFPQMKLGTNDEKMFIPLQWVHDQLKAKNPALLVTIGMCCNSFEEAFAKKEPLFSVDYGNGYYYTESVKQAVQKLFLGYTGDIIATSASPGQISKGARSASFGELDMYTLFFIIHFEEGTSEGELEWDDFLNSVSESVNDIRHGQQTPFHQCNIKKKDINYLGDDYPQNQDQILFDKLNDSFAKLLNTQLSIDTKQEFIPTMLSMFIQTPIIIILGKNGTVVSSYTDAEEFLSHIAASTVKEVIPVKITPSPSNHIYELIVKELY